MIPATYCAYLAGLVDGEGSIGLYHNRRWAKDRARYRWMYVVDVSATYRPVLAEMRRRLGMGFILTTKRAYSSSLPGHTGRKKTQYSWRVARKEDIHRFLTRILPYMREKRPQAQLMLRAIEGTLRQPTAARRLKAAKRAK